MHTIQTTERPRRRTLWWVAGVSTAALLAASTTGAAGADTRSTTVSATQNEAADSTPRMRAVGQVTLTPPTGARVRFDIYSYTGTQQNSTSIGSQSGGAGAGKVTFQPIVVTKHVDASSPRLFSWLAGGTALTSATIQLYAPNRSVVEIITCKLVVLSALTTSNSGAGTDQLHEQLSMQVGAIQVKVNSSSASWNQVTNSGN